LGVDGHYRPVGSEKVAAVSEKYRLPDDYILYVGSVEKRKNLLRLLQAYAYLRDRGETCPLVIVGIQRLNNVDVVAMLQELGLQRSVILAGYVADEDLPALYSGADLFVFPSLYEGFGLPPLEAMACGAPVVCSNAASLPEVVDDAALMVDPHNVEQLSEAMRRVLASRGLQDDLRARGLGQAKRFTWERTARETIAVYREVCG
jgi:glycosyltransferase involved in cell wall biosynthesis